MTVAGAAFEEPNRSKKDPVNISDLGLVWVATGVISGLVRSMFRGLVLPNASEGLRGLFAPGWRNNS